jgi:hypothetical protein
MPGKRDEKFPKDLHGPNKEPKKDPKKIEEFFSSTDKKERKFLPPPNPKDRNPEQRFENDQQE